MSRGGVSSANLMCVDGQLLPQKKQKAHNPNPSSPPFPYDRNTYYPLKFNTQQCICTYGSFIPPGENGVGTTTGFSVCSPSNEWPLHLGKTTWPPKYAPCETLCHIARPDHPSPHPQDTYIFNNIDLINSRIRHPLSHHHHLDKLLVSTIVDQIQWTTYQIIVYNVRAHIGITNDEITDQSANDN